eukprot:scaffold61507_cov57-Phaeocystis_antarctica.AAC.2
MAVEALHGRTGSRLCGECRVRRLQWLPSVERGSAGVRSPRAQREPAGIASAPPGPLPLGKGSGSNSCSLKPNPAPTLTLRGECRARRSSAVCGRCWRGVRSLSWWASAPPGPLPLEALSSAQ